MQTTDTASPQRVRALLEALPESCADAGLWPRIVAAHARRVVRARRRRAVWIASGMAAALAAFFALPRAITSGSVDDEVAVWQQRSQALERQWQAADNVPGDRRARAELHWIDGELQSAYDRRANQDELLALWKQRNTALQSLINNGPGMARAITRI